MFCSCIQCVLCEFWFCAWSSADLKCMVAKTVVLFFFFFKQKTAYEMRISDWSSDVCSSDLDADGAVVVEPMLESIRAHIAGAIHAPGEEVGDAYRFCVEAQRALTVQSGRSEEHTSALQSLMRSSYDVF